MSMIAYPCLKEFEETVKISISHAFERALME